MIKTKVTTNKVSIDEQTTTTTHCTGNFYYNIPTNSIYILCIVDYDNRVCLSCWY